MRVKEGIRELQADRVNLLSKKLGQLSCNISICSLRLTFENCIQISTLMDAKQCLRKRNKEEKKIPCITQFLITPHHSTHYKIIYLLVTKTTFAQNFSISFINSIVDPYPMGGDGVCVKCIQFLLLFFHCEVIMNRLAYPVFNYTQWEKILSVISVKGPKEKGTRSFMLFSPVAQKCLSQTK